MSLAINLYISLTTYFYSRGFGQLFADKTADQASAVRCFLKNAIDLIVMGRLGKSGVKRFLIGGLSKMGVRGSNVEVLISR